jgi:hypothetical protein
MEVIAELRGYREYLEKQEEPADDDLRGVWRRAAYMVALKMQQVQVTDELPETNLTLWTNWGRGRTDIPVFSEACTTAGTIFLVVIIGAIVGLVEGASGHK